MEKALIRKSVPDELKAVQLCKKGDAGAFNVLVLRYQDRVFNMLFRMTGDRQLANDLAQETFIKAYKAIGGFRVGSSFYTWIYRIAVNTAYSYMRKEKAQKRVNTVALEDNPLGRDGVASKKKNNPVQILERSELEMKVQQYISELDNTLRSVVILRDIEGMEYQVIAEILDIPIGTVKSRLHRGRMELREKLKGFI